MTSKQYMIDETMTFKKYMINQAKKYQNNECFQNTILNKNVYNLVDSNFFFKINQENYPTISTIFNDILKEKIFMEFLY